jgi:hypothetical protein
VCLLGGSAVVFIFGRDVAGDRHGLVLMFIYSTPINFDCHLAYICLYMFLLQVIKKEEREEEKKAVFLINLV